MQLTEAVQNQDIVNQPNFWIDLQRGHKAIPVRGPDDRQFKTASDSARGPTKATEVDERPGGGTQQEEKLEEDGQGEADRSNHDDVTRSLIPFFAD